MVPSAGTPVGLFTWPATFLEPPLSASDVVVTVIAHSRPRLTQHHPGHSYREGPTLIVFPGGLELGMEQNELLRSLQEANLKPATWANLNSLQPRLWDLRVEAKKVRLGGGRGC